MKNILIAIAVYAMVAQPAFAVSFNRSRRSTDSCGVPRITSGLIVRGQDFPRGSFPWIVALMHTCYQPHAFFCAGTLISNTFVISAAHCILNKGTTEKFLARHILAIFGAHNLKDYSEPERIALSPKKILIHDDWNHLTQSFDADVSLLEFFTHKIHFGDFIQPICLWSSENEPPVTEGVVTGWGKSEDQSKVHENKPKLISVPIINNELCLLGEATISGLSSHRTFCAGLRNGTGVCSGDSGGGLFIKVDEVFYLRGIVSSSLIKSDGGCEVSNNAVYTNVLKFMDWIVEKTGVVVIAPKQTPSIQVPADAWSWLTKRVDKLTSCSKYEGVAACYHNDMRRRDEVCEEPDCIRKDKWSYDYFFGGECYCCKC